MGQPNTSSMGPIGSEPKLELPPSPLFSLSSGIAALPITGGSLSPERVPLHLIANLQEKEAIFGVLGREKEEKEKEKEEKGLGFVLSECGLWFWENK